MSKHISICSFKSNTDLHIYEMIKADYVHVLHEKSFLGMCIMQNTSKWNRRTVLSGFTAVRSLIVGFHSRTACKVKHIQCKDSRGRWKETFLLTTLHSFCNALDAMKQLQHVKYFFLILGNHLHQIIQNHKRLLIRTLRWAFRNSSVYWTNPMSKIFECRTAQSAQLNFHSIFSSMKQQLCSSSFKVEIANVTFHQRKSFVNHLDLSLHGLHSIFRLGNSQQGSIQFILTFDNVIFRSAILWNLVSNRLEYFVTMSETRSQMGAFLDALQNLTSINSMILLVHFELHQIYRVCIESFSTLISK